MDKLDAMQVYVAVVDAHSFARAEGARAAALHGIAGGEGAGSLARGAASPAHHPQAQRDGGGSPVFEECKKAAGEMAAMAPLLSGRSAQPAGAVQGRMQQSLACHCILPRIGEFCSRSRPELILCSGDNVEDIIQEGFDCVIRTPDGIRRFHHPVARPLARYRWMVLASPARLTAHGRPQSIDELYQHRAVGYLNHLTVPGGPSTGFSPLDEGDCAIRMRETLVVDETDASHSGWHSGLGLIRVASYLAQPYLQSGRYACLEQAASDLPLSLVYPQTAICRRRCARFMTGAGVCQTPHKEASMPGHRPGYWPRMAWSNPVTSQFSAGSCARRLCRKCTA